MRSRDHIRRYASTGSGALLIGYTLRAAYFGAVQEHSMIGTLALLCGFSALGLGLIWQNFWARRIAAAVSVGIAIFLPVGYINPFAAMDVPDPPTLPAILWWMIPTVAGLLTVAWLIDPPRCRLPGNPRSDS